jgi:biopolymer transport protein ExbD
MTEVGFYPSRRLKKREGRLIAYPNQLPLIGTAILLLVLFMVAVGTAGMVDYAVSWDLAAVRHPTPMPWANRYDAIRVGLTRDGLIYFQNTKTTNEDLPERIRECVKAGSERRVYLSVDARAKYSDVKSVLDGIRAAGMEKVTFLVEKQRQ